ncbi:MAG: hypothetical protein CSA33_01560 [Desulfobulbus propionicus]|nr:MAG: hypothetical protein CSA33_01560 [Desulfobulbus propionicus]
MEKILFVTVLWLGWCSLHSLLICDPIKDQIIRRSPLTASCYRLGYVLFSTVTLIPLALFTHLQPQKVLFTWHGPYHIIQAGLALYSGLLFIAGGRAYDLPYFLGLRQLLHSRMGFKDQAQFHTNGILGLVRHPWYSGGIALLWCVSPITDMSLSVRLLLSLYFVAGSYLEEKRLVREIGPSYLLYQKQVPMLIPNWSSLLRTRR